MKTETKEPTAADIKTWYENAEADVGDWHELAGFLVELLEAAEQDLKIYKHPSNTVIATETLDHTQQNRTELVESLIKAEAIIDSLEQGIQKFLDGDEPKQLSSKFSGCIHRDLNHQDCARCINDYFSGLLNGARDDNS